MDHAYHLLDIILKLRTLNASSIKSMSDERGLSYSNDGVMSGLCTVQNLVK